MATTPVSRPRDHRDPQVASYLRRVMDDVVAKNPGEPEFHQAVREVVRSLGPVLSGQPRYVRDKILEQMLEPDRSISFRVDWVDDAGVIHVNRGYRIR